MAPVVARRQRALVIVLETLPGAGSKQLRRHERAWIHAALRDAGGDALAHQVTPPQESDERGPRAPAQLASQRQWPVGWVEALAAFFREARHPQRSTLIARHRIPALRSLTERATAAHRSDDRAGPAAAAE